MRSSLTLLVVAFGLGCVISSPLFADQRVNGYCTQGNQVVTTNSVSSTNRVQGSFPRCTVEVFNTGTLIHPAGGLFSDNGVTALGNPFTADANGYWFFYAANGRYDVKLSGGNNGGFPSPFTLGDVLLADPVLTSATDYIAGITNKPTFDPRQYNFASQNPTGTLTANTPATVTLTPCPAGLNASDPAHAVYISGVGNAEGVFITGGTCVAGSNGTIQFTPLHSYAAGWSLSPAWCGIAEAAQAAATAGGGVVQATTLVGCTVHALLTLQSNVELIGGGAAMPATVAANEFNLLTTGPWYQNPFWAVVSATAGASKVVIRDLVVTFATQSATLAGNFGYGMAFKDVVDSTFSNIEVNQSPVLITNTTFIPFSFVGLAQRNVVQNSRVFNQVCTVNNQGVAGFWSSGRYNKIIGNYVQNGCNSAFVSGINTFSLTNLGNEFSGNTFNLAGSTMTAAAQAFIADNANSAQFSDNFCLGNNVGPACFAVAQDTPGSDALDNIFTNNHANNCGYGFLIAGTGSQWARNTQINGGTVESCASGGISVTDQVDRLTVNGPILTGNTGFGMQTFSTIANSITNMIVTNTQAINNVGPGFTFTANGGLIPVVNLSFVSNHARDTRAGGARTQTYGLNLPANTAVNQIINSNNFLQNNLTADTNVTVGIVALIAAGGVWGPNADNTPDAYLNLSSGAGGNIFGTTTLVNGLNSNIAQGNYGSVFITGPSGAFSVGGFTQSFDGKELDVFNNTVQAMTVVNGDVSSTLGQRINTLTNANIVKSTCPCWVFLKYSGAANAWLVKGSYP